MTTNSEIFQELQGLNIKLSALIELNDSLVKQNLKLSEAVYGKVQLPQTTTQDHKKDLYYCTLDELFNLIHGPGTFDNKPVIKTLTNSVWDQQLKAWKVTSSVEDIKSKLPDITFKHLTMS
tara:strand:+ start:690 stop:1052 length:363 start_codon:yes stop_codon:yes gene_type:complete